jgi:hypothetical protein
MRLPALRVVVVFIMGPSGRRVNKKSGWGTNVPTGRSFPPAEVGKAAT